MDKNQAENRIRTHGWLAERPPEFQDAVLARAKLVRFRSRETVYRLGELGGGIYGPVSGGFLISIPAAGRVVRPAHVATVGTWFGYGPALSQTQRSFEVVAIQDSYAWTVTAGAVAEIASLSPKHALNWSSMAEFGTRTAVGCISDLLIRDNRKRVAAVLLRVTGGLMLPFEQEFALPQGLLAELSNTSRQICNKTLIDLFELGFIEKTYGKIFIVNRKKIFDYFNSE